eukprot:NODE_656_length_5493_cov_0.311828.p4 type:complete len:209 gc:universal NODE_656_length_5493_cov_0.311828:3535-2909(-)
MESMMQVESNVQIQNIACICDQQVELNGETMIQCELCSSWIHCSCVGLDSNFLPSEYFCSRCKPIKTLEKSDSAKNLTQRVEVNEEYQITSFDELSDKHDKLITGYMISCKKPDAKLKLPEVVERVLEIEEYLNQTDLVLDDDRYMKMYLDTLLENCKKYTNNDKDLNFIKLAHNLLSKLIVHNSDKIKKMRDHIDEIKSEHSSSFFD